MLRIMAPAYSVARLGGWGLSTTLACYLATRGDAEPLMLDDKIDSLAPGMNADVIVLALKSPPLIECRMQFTNTIKEALFVQMALADDRAIRATCIAGDLAYRRD